MPAPLESESESESAGERTEALSKPHLVTKMYSTILHFARYIEQWLQRHPEAGSSWARRPRV